MIFIFSLCMVFFLPIFIYAEDTASSTSMNKNAVHNIYSTKTALDWVSDSILNVINSLVPNIWSTDGIEGRKKKRIKLNKYVLPLLIGFLLIKSILLPIALKSLAVLSGKAIVLSLMSLILAAIVGLKAVAQHGYYGQQSQYRSDSDYVHLPLREYRRKDIEHVRDNFEDDDPYKYYRDRRRRK